MPDYLSRDLRARLLEGALEIIDRDGVEGLTVRAVAKAADCSTMGVYTHYQGKSGLLEAVVTWGFDQLDLIMGQSHRADAGVAGIVSCAGEFRAWALEHPVIYQVMFAAPMPGYSPSESVQARTWETFSAHRARIAASFESPDADPERWHDAAVSIWASVHGLVSLELLKRAQGAGWESLIDFSRAVENAVASAESLGAVRA